MDSEIGINAIAELDKAISDGYDKFRQCHSAFYDGMKQSYVQGFLDGIRYNLDELAIAYKKKYN